MKRINWKYALGEIIIVIIGITIAFSLNNWKENRADEQLKNQYLENLISDIEHELEILQSNQESFQNKLELIKEIRPFLGNPNTKRDSTITKVFKLAQAVPFYPVNATYQTLVNSGDMKLIDDFELRRSIEEHYSFHNVVLQDYERIDAIHKKYLGDFFIYEIDFQSLRNGNSDFLDKPLLGNILSSLQGAFYFAIQGSKKCMESNSNLLAKIKAAQI